MGRQHIETRDRMFAPEIYTHNKLFFLPFLSGRDGGSVPTSMVREWLTRFKPERRRIISPHADATGSSFQPIRGGPLQANFLRYVGINADYKLDVGEIGEIERQIISGGKGLIAGLTVGGISYTYGPGFVTSFRNGHLNPKLAEVYQAQVVSAEF